MHSFSCSDRRAGFENFGARRPSPVKCPMNALLVASSPGCLEKMGFLFAVMAISKAQRGCFWGSLEFLLRHRLCDPSALTPQIGAWGAYE